MNIFINPGHAPNGNPDPGAVNGTTGLRECDVALAVGNLAAKYLIAAGVSVTNVFQCDDLGEFAPRRTPVVLTSSFLFTATATMNQVLPVPRLGLVPEAIVAANWLGAFKNRL